MSIAFLASLFRDATTMVHALGEHNVIPKIEPMNYMDYLAQFPNPGRDLIDRQLEEIRSDVLRRTQAATAPHVSHPDPGGSR